MTIQPSTYDESAVVAPATPDAELIVSTGAIDERNTAQIENKAGTLLPSTGGMGTTLFYILGGALVVAAGVLLVTKRRMENDK